MSDGYGLIGATAFVYLGIGLSKAIYKHQTYRVITMFRGSLIPLIFNKTVTLSDDTLDQSAAVTLMSTDIDSIATGIQNLHDIWADVIQIGVGVYLLERQVGASCIFVVILTVGMGKNMGAWNKAVQERVSFTSAILGQLKAVKLSGLSEKLSTDIQGMRVRELVLSKQFRKLIVWMNLIANVADAFTPVVTFIAAVFWHTSVSDGLNTSEALTALSILALVSAPVTNLLSSVPQLSATIACFDRIETYLLTEEHTDTRGVMSEPNHGKTFPSSPEEDLPDGTIELVSLDTGTKLNAATPRGDVVLRVKEACFSIETKQEPILRSVSFDVNRSTFTMITGSVGSGKSTLSKGLLGEFACSEGSVSIARIGAAYCAQKPWLQNASIRANVTGHASFDTTWYQTVLHACDLMKDITHLPDGDESIVGSGGISLSGGQKKRLALARAIYANKPLVLLDDVFSGLDRVTEKIVLRRLFSSDGLFRQKRMTVVLVTHDLARLSYADNIVAISKEGIVLGKGKLDELEIGNSLKSLQKDLLLTDSDESTDTQKQELISDSDQDKQDIRRQTGDLTLYTYYLNSIGWPRALLYLSFATVYIFLGKFPQVWLEMWTNTSKDVSSNTFVGVYVTLATGCVISAVLMMGYFFIVVLPKSAEYLHWQLVKSVMSAPFWFLCATDNGVLLNRFSQDMSLIDKALPLSAFTTTLDVLVILAETVLIARGSSYIAAIIPLCMVVVYLLQKYYLRTSRQLRFLDLENKSPLYSHFTETMSGLSTIRAFSWQSAMEEINLTRLDVSQRPYYLLYCIQRWLNLVLDLLVAAIAVVLVTMAVTMQHTTSDGRIGLALVNIVTFSQSLSQLVNSWTSLETSLGAISRLRSFVSDTPREDEGVLDENPPFNWPSEGEVHIQLRSASYGPLSQSVLRNVNIEIRPGERIAVCGRTGSGKSSLLLAISRLMSVSSGCIQIDGVDIATVPGQQLRSKIAVIPQDTLALPGSVRYNIDPRAISTDDSITSALEKVKLWHKIQGCGGLDADYEVVQLSHGQRQLFALASAILRCDARVVLIDELTSGIDQETDETVVRKVLQNELADRTVISVIHRLENISDWDKVAVMEKGELLEFDRPATLLARDSALKKLWGGVDL